MKNELIVGAILLTIIPMIAFADAPYWNDYDGDGQLTEADVDAMCDEDYVDEEYKDKQNCKKLYNWIEDTYVYETEESESDYRENYDYLKEQSEEELNDGWYGGPRDSEGNLVPFEDVPDSEYDNEDRTPLKYEKAYREYLKKEYGMDLDGKEYWKIPRDEKIEMEKEFEEQKEDKYRDITTAGEDVEGFERFVEEKKGKNYNFETDYQWETPEEQRKLEEEFNEMKLKRAGEDLKPTEEIPIKGVGPDIVDIKP